MRTDELIAMLAEDHAAQPRPAPLKRVFVLSCGLGLLIAAALFAAALGPRSDFAQALGTWRFDFKFVVTLTLAAATAPLLLRSSRPEVRAGDGAALPLAAAPLLLATATVVELSVIPSSAWATRAIGVNALPCLVTVTLLSAPTLIAALYALRRGAPSAPGYSGALAGLLSSALAAALYASHCKDDSPLFVAVWYTLGISFVTLAGLLAGRRVLRW